jgi:Ca-activated chloride channel family protein
MTAAIWPHEVGFGLPAGLLALLGVPLFFVVAALIRRHRSRASVSFTNVAVLRPVARGSHRWWLRPPILLLALAIGVAALAVARPRLQLSGAQRETTVVLLVDVSGSMKANDIRPARIFAAINAMRDFVARLPPNDKVGLVTFSDEVEVLRAPTVDHAAIDSGLTVLAPEGGTALGEGVTTAVKVIEESLGAAGSRHASGATVPAAIVLESDGAQNRGGITPFAAGKLAAQAGIPIYGVALGTRHGYVTTGTGLLSRSIAVPPAPGTVALLARLTGGKAFDATSADSLNSIYRELRSRVAHHPTLTDVSPWFDLAAAVLLVCGVALARIQGGLLP